MKILVLGDPHCKPSNLKESEDLMQFVLSKCKELKIDRLEILGDLFDTHTIINLFVFQFWEKWFNKLHDEKIETYVLRGNHDMSGDYSNNYTALQSFSHLNEYIKIVVSPVKDGPFGYMPYIHDNAEFVEEANSLADQGATILVSHTTYQGSKYDNGMFAPDGVDSDLLDSRLKLLISGHVHSEQEFGRVWYPGTARWLSKSCANRRKGIWLCQHAEDGKMISKEFISTHEVCTPIVSLVWKQGEERPEIPKNSKVDLELVGSSNWVSEQKGELKGQVSLSSKITDIKKSKARKSGKSLYEFLSEHYQAEPEKREKLIKYLGGLNLV